MSGRDSAAAASLAGDPPQITDESRENDGGAAAADSSPGAAGAAAGRARPTFRATARAVAGLAVAPKASPFSVKNPPPGLGMARKTPGGGSPGRPGAVSPSKPTARDVIARVRAHAAAQEEAARAGELGGGGRDGPLPGGTTRTAQDSVRFHFPTASGPGSPGGVAGAVRGGGGLSVCSRSLPPFPPPPPFPLLPPPRRISSTTSIGDGRGCTRRAGLGLGSPLSIYLYLSLSLSLPHSLSLALGLALARFAPRRRARPSPCPVAPRRAAPPPSLPDAPSLPPTPPPQTAFDRLITAAREERARGEAQPFQKDPLPRLAVVDAPPETALRSQREGAKGHRDGGSRASFGSVALDNELGGEDARGAPLPPPPASGAPGGSSGSAQRRIDFGMPYGAPSAVAAADLDRAATDASAVGGARVSRADRPVDTIDFADFAAGGGGGAAPVWRRGSLREGGALVFGSGNDDNDDGGLFSEGAEERRSTGQAAGASSPPVGVPPPRGLVPAPPVAPSPRRDAPVLSAASRGPVAHLRAGGSPYVPSYSLGTRGGRSAAPGPGSGGGVVGPVNRLGGGGGGGGFAGGAGGGGFGWPGHAVSSQPFGEGGGGGYGVSADGGDVRLARHRPDGEVVATDTAGDASGGLPPPGSLAADLGALLGGGGSSALGSRGGPLSADTIVVARAPPDAAGTVGRDGTTSVVVGPTGSPVAPREVETRVHRLILSARSEVLRGLLIDADRDQRGSQRSSREAHHQPRAGRLLRLSVEPSPRGTGALAALPRLVVVADPDAVAELIKYLYTDRCALSSNHVWTLLEAAEDLQLPGLRSRCLSFVEASLNESTACSYLERAERLGHRGLAEHCRAVTRERFRAAARSPGWLGLDASTVRALVEDDSICAPELTVFRAVLAWLRRDPRSRAEAGHRLLLSVRYPLMSEHQLSSEVDRADEVRASHDLTRRVLDALKTKVSSRPEDLRPLRRRVLFPGVVHDVPTAELREEGWRELAAGPFSAPLEPDVLASAGTFEYLLLGARRRGADSLRVAAMGRCAEVLRPAELLPNELVAGVIDNGVHWYHLAGGVLGFADASDAVRLGPDGTDEGPGEHRVSVPLCVGGGGRAGEDRDVAVDGQGAERVLMVWQQL